MKKFRTNELKTFPSTTGVYQISFDGSKKVYIGSASVNSSKIKSGNGFYSRWKKHIHLLKNNKHHSPALQNAFNKYGEDLLSFEVLQECEPDECILKEQYYIDYFDAFHKGYNGRPIANNNLGIKQSEKQKKKIVDKYKDLRNSIAPEVIELYKLNKTTREISKELNISRGVITKIFKENNIIGRSVSDYTKKKIYQYDLNGNLIKEWDSIRGCASELNIEPVSIRFVLHGNCKQSKGFYFSYENLSKYKVINKLQDIGDWIPKTNKYININQFDSNGNYLKTWNDVKEIMNFFGFANNGPITKAIKNNTKYKSFYWKL